MTDTEPRTLAIRIVASFAWTAIAFDLAYMWTMLLQQLPLVAGAIFGGAWAFVFGGTVVRRRD
jgi:hypothetical protein